MKGFSGDYSHDCVLVASLICGSYRLSCNQVLYGYFSHKGRGGSSGYTPPFDPG